MLDGSQAIEGLDALESGLKRWMADIISAQGELESLGIVAAKVTRNLETIRSLRAQLSGEVDDRYLCVF